MAYTASNVFLNLKNKVDKILNQAHQGSAARNYIYSQDRVTPYDHYKVWTEAQGMYEIFNNKDYLNITIEILKIHMLWVYSNNHMTRSEIGFNNHMTRSEIGFNNNVTRSEIGFNNQEVTISNNIHDRYYTEGVDIVDKFLSEIRSETTEDLNYLISFAESQYTRPNFRAADAASKIGSFTTVEGLQPLNIWAATMIVNDYLNPTGIQSFYRKSSKIISDLNPTELNNIINIGAPNPINPDEITELNPTGINKTKYLIDTLGLNETDLNVIYYDLRQLFDHWVMSEYSSPIDYCYSRICLLYTSGRCRRLLTCRSRWSPYH